METSNVSSQATSQAKSFSNKISSSAKDMMNEFVNHDHKEGDLTARVENQTAKVPSIGWLALAVGSMVVSAGLLGLAKRKEYANFVGMWAPCFLLVGIYNKLVKIEMAQQPTDHRTSLH